MVSSAIHQTYSALTFSLGSPFPLSIQYPSNFRQQVSRVSLQLAHSSYGFNTFQSSLIQLALSLGAIIGTIINPFQDRLYLSSGHKNKKQPGKPIPEARLYFSIPGSLLFTAGLFWYGWSSYPHVHFMVPTLAIGCIGLGIYSIYMATGEQPSVQKVDLTGSYLFDRRL